ncbi:protein kinase superfamily protein isoform X2 [Wolffia australiana]
MVFKGRFFSSKKSDSSSPDGSNSPKTTFFGSPNRSDKKKVKSSQDKEGKGKESVDCRVPEFPQSAPAKLRKNPAAKDASTKSSTAGLETLPPIMASSLGLNRIKTRSGPLPLEGAGIGLRAYQRGSNLGVSNFGKEHAGGCSTSSASSTSAAAIWTSSEESNGKKKNVCGPDRVPLSQPSSNRERGKEQGRDRANLESPVFQKGQCNSSWNNGEKIEIMQARTPPQQTESAYDTCETPKESESPRFKAIMQATSAPRKKFPADIKSFSHELNSKGVRPFPFWKPRGINNLKEVLKVIQVKFEKAKEEVNSDLSIFAGDLIGIMEKSAESHPEWKETLEDLLILARSCDMMTAGEFWLQCEGIVQDLDDCRQELPMGVLKKLYTRMLFILTRCTRLLQFHKESGFTEDEFAVNLRESKIFHSVVKPPPPSVERIESVKRADKSTLEAYTKKSYSQEQSSLNWKSQEIKPAQFFLRPAFENGSEGADIAKDRLVSSKAFPSSKVRNQKGVMAKKKEENRDSPGILRKGGAISDVDLQDNSPEVHIFKDSSPKPSKHRHQLSWGYWGDQQFASDEGSIMCRICEEYVLTSHVEGHSKICTISDRCDQKGLSVDERLLRIAEILEKMIASYLQKDTHLIDSPDLGKTNSNVTEESEALSPKHSDWSRQGSTDAIDCFHDTDSPLLTEDLKGLPSMTCKTRFGPKFDHGMGTSSAGSMTPRSPILTPRTRHLDLLLAGKAGFSESDDIPQIVELADIARCIASTPIDEEASLQYLVSCLEDLQEVVDRRKLDALTVQTFGTRIEKLHREKYLQLCDNIDVEKTETTTLMDEENDVIRSLRESPVHPLVKDRTSIDDFEIMKPISRGAFGRVFLAKKRTTGDLFAIKVLRKADMIRKNAVESIIAERDILISVQNPFVVRFFYSFTSRENLYLVMEYLNGGDLYSLLRNLGCLDESVARIYIAEVVLALEYLHSLHVVHRDLKPDNLLIAHDGHIKLTDFGLSKVGLINSTDDLSGPTVSDILCEDEPQLSVSEHQNERRKKRSAVGTPDYLAPEILLGTGHSASADWWSVGVILFEIIVGIPPFNAEHPQTIFDNILNRKIPWPRIPDEMSFEAHDLIDKLLTEDPTRRLGSQGAIEVKQHEFFKDINWDTLARQKAAFVPESESALDTSYFTSRYSWNLADEHLNEGNESEGSSEDGSVSCSSSCTSNRHHEPVSDSGGFSELDSALSVNYSFSNFSFKNLSQLASINYDLLSKGWKEDSPTNPEP